MALTVTNDRGAINTKGGSVFKAQEKKYDGTDISPTDTIHDFGEISESTFRDKKPYTAIYNEAGEKVANESGNRDSGFDLTLLQRDSDTLNLVSQVDGKYFLTMRKLSETSAISGKTQYMFAFGQIAPDVELKLPGGGVPIKFEGIVVESALTISALAVTSWTTAITTTVTIPEGDWKVIVEV